MTEAVSTQDNNGQRVGTKVLVAYYSRSEVTHQVAVEIGRTMDADLLRITDRTDRAGPAGFLKSGVEARTKAIIDIDPPGKDPADYDLVVVGTPVWTWTMSSPIRSFLAKYGSRIKKAAFFCTADGRESNTNDDMARLIERPAQASMVVFKRELYNGRSSDKVHDFVGNVRKAMTQS